MKETYQQGTTSPAGPPVKAHERGRVCQWPECSTTISIYNAREYCWLHAAPEPVRFRGERHAN
jgi:hypothetical protein